MSLYPTSNGQRYLVVYDNGRGQGGYGNGDTIDEAETVARAAWLEALGSGSATCLPCEQTAERRAHLMVVGGYDADDDRVRCAECRGPLVYVTDRPAKRILVERVDGELVEQDWPEEYREELV